MSNPGGDVYEQFYRSLVVQHTLQHVRRHALSNASISLGRRNIQTSSFKKDKNVWHVFLDNLCILCDHKTGGLTVTAVAAERDLDVKSRTTLWVFVNGQRARSKIALRVEDHLHSLIKLLSRTTRNEQGSQQLMLESFDDSVHKAKDRVNNYRKKLQGRIAALKSRADELFPEGQSLWPLNFTITDLLCYTEHSLIEAVDALVENNKHVSDLCRGAYDFRATDYARELIKRAWDEQDDNWTHICHFIGRLGSWLKATRFLFEHASHFAQILSNYEVVIAPIEQCMKSDAPPPFPDVEKLLLQTLPPHIEVSKARLEQLFGRGAFAVAQALLQDHRANGWRLKMHAESTMA